MAVVRRAIPQGSAWLAFHMATISKLGRPSQGSWEDGGVVVVDGWIPIVGAVLGTF